MTDQEFDAHFTPQMIGYDKGAVCKECAVWVPALTPYRFKESTNLPLHIQWHESLGADKEPVPAKEPTP